jgi:hypothetical protein
MKNKPVKILALLLALTFVFSFSACKKTEPGQTTTTETTAEVTTLIGETTSEATTAPGETTTQGTTVPGDTTAVPAGISAPVGGSISDIVAFYNQYANTTKKYMESITVKRDMGTVTQITKMALFKGILQDLLDKQLQDESITKTFNNGYVGSDKNDTLEKFLPRGAGKNMSDLTAAGVKSASCTTSGSGWVVKITLYKEIVSGLSTPPKHHTSVMDPMTIDPKDLDPFTIGEGKVTYGDVNSKDTGASLTATFNDKGYLVNLRMDAPLQIAGKLGFNNKGINTVIDGKWWGDMTFKYS